MHVMRVVSHALFTNPFISTFFCSFLNQNMSLYLKLSSSGQGRYISRFLSHRLWSAPSRLCFAIYLVHVTIINLYVLSQTTKLRYSHLDFAVSFAAIVFLSFAAGLLIVVFIESPACRLSKHLETSLSAFFSNADAPKHDEIRQERSINSRAQSLGEQEHELMPITTRS